jgi:anti-sigma B factor antagonist
MSQHGSLSSELAGDETEVLMLDGEFDLRALPEFDQAVDHALESGRRNLVVDLRGVSFLDVTMLSALVRGCALLLAHDRRFALIRPRPLIWRTFVLTGLSRIPTFGGVTEAVESFRVSQGAGRTLPGSQSA